MSLSASNESDEKKLSDDSDNAPSPEEVTAVIDTSAPKQSTVVPPWQRGTGADTSESAASSATSGEGVDVDAALADDSAAATGAHEKPGPPPHGVVVTGDDAASGKTPLNKLDASGTKAAAGDRFVESPTRNIDRKDVRAESLPDLGAIHHPQIAAEVAAAAPQRSAPTQIGAGRPLRASVQIRRIDPWATFKISAVLAVVGFFIWLISVAVLYLILDGMGVWDQVNSSFGTLTTADGSSGGGDIFGAGAVFGWAIALGVINAILLTALATIGAFVYNICADLIGGAEVTLADLD